MNDNYNFFINRIALKYYRIENKNHFEKAFYLLNAILENPNYRIRISKYRIAELVFRNFRNFGLEFRNFRII